MENNHEWDSSLPNFTYSQGERAQKLAEGMTEQEINEEEARKRLDLVEGKLQQEITDANKDLPEDQQMQIAA